MAEREADFNAAWRSSVGGRAAHRYLRDALARDLWQLLACGYGLSRHYRSSVLLACIRASPLQPSSWHFVDIGKPYAGTIAQGIEGDMKGIRVRHFSRLEYRSSVIAFSTTSFSEEAKEQGSQSDFYTTQPCYTCVEFLLLPLSHFLQVTVACNENEYIHACNTAADEHEYGHRQPEVELSTGPRYRGPRLPLTPLAFPCPL